MYVCKLSFGSPKNIWFNPQTYYAQTIRYGKHRALFYDCAIDKRKILIFSEGNILRSFRRLLHEKKYFLLCSAFSCHKHNWRRSKIWWFAIFMPTSFEWLTWKLQLKFPFLNERTFIIILIAVGGVISQMHFWWWLVSFHKMQIAKRSFHFTRSVLYIFTQKWP